MSFLKRGFFGPDANKHHLLHVKFGSGLIEDLQKLPHGFKINSMDHKEYFEKYLQEPEGAERVVAAIKTIVAYERPQMNTHVGLATVPYKTGINKFCGHNMGDNINKIFVVFEEFGTPGGGGTANGHFGLLWHFPETFDKKKRSNRKFCYFDPFGRERDNDPEINYYQKTPCKDYQTPESSTCALWCIFALLQFALQVGRFPGIEPVEYNGKEETLNMKPFQILHERQWKNNELVLYRYLLKNYFIFQPRVPQARPMIGDSTISTVAAAAGKEPLPSHSRFPQSVLDEMYYNPDQ